MLFPLNPWIGALLWSVKKKAPIYSIYYSEIIMKIYAYLKDFTLIEFSVMKPIEKRRFNGFPKIHLLIIIIAFYLIY